MKLIFIILIGSIILTMAEGFLDVKFGHLYDQIIFKVLFCIYGMVIGMTIFKD